MNRNKRVTATSVRVFHELLVKCEEQWGFKKVSTIEHFSNGHDFRNFIVCGRLESDDEVQLYHVNRYNGVVGILQD